MTEGTLLLLGFFSIAKGAMHITSGIIKGAGRSHPDGQACFRIQREEKAMRACFFRSIKANGSLLDNTVPSLLAAKPSKPSSDVPVGERRDVLKGNPGRHAGTALLRFSRCADKQRATLHRPKARLFSKAQSFPTRLHDHRNGINVVYEEMYDTKK